MRELISLKVTLKEVQLEALVAQYAPPSAVVAELIAIVTAEYVRLGYSLPNEHAWKWGKLMDGVGGCRAAEQMAKKFNFSERLTAVLRFMAFSADIGRLVIANEHIRGDESRTQAVHGAASVETLQSLGVLDDFTSLGFQIALAIKHHSDAATPVLADLGGNDIAWTLCCMLRDLDMLSIIAGKAEMYVMNEAERERQLVANKLVMSNKVTPVVLERFEAGGPIDRSACETFPDWLLQFLSWPRNFTFQELLNLAIESRGLQNVLDWMADSWGGDIDKDTMDRILSATEHVYGI